MKRLVVVALLSLVACKVHGSSSSKEHPDAAPDAAVPLPLEVRQSIERRVGQYIDALYAKSFDEAAVAKFLAPASEKKLLERWRRFRKDKRGLEAQVRWGSSKVDEAGARLAVYERWREDVSGFELTHDLVTFYDLVFDAQRRVVSQVASGALIAKRRVGKACMKSCLDRFAAWEAPPTCGGSTPPRARVKVGDVVGDLGETVQSGASMLRRVSIGRDRLWIVDCLEWVKERDGGLGFVEETPADVCHRIAVDACKRACSECEQKEGFGCCVWAGRPSRIFCQTQKECVKIVEREICTNADENAAAIRACAAATDEGTCSRSEHDDRGLELADACDRLFQR